MTPHHDKERMTLFYAELEKRADMLDAANDPAAASSMRLYRRFIEAYHVWEAQMRDRFPDGVPQFLPIVVADACACVVTAMISNFELPPNLQAECASLTTLQFIESVKTQLGNMELGGVLGRVQ